MNAAVLDRLADPAYTPSDNPLLDIEKRAFIAGVVTASMRAAELDKRANPIGGAFNLLGKGFGLVDRVYSGANWLGDAAGRMVSPLVTGAGKGLARAAGSGVSSAANAFVNNPMAFAIGMPSLMHSIGKYTSSPYAPQQTVSGLSRSRTGA